MPKSLATQLRSLSRERMLSNDDQKLLRRAAKAVERSSPEYVNKMVKLINNEIRKHKKSPEVSLKHGQFDGRKICAAWEKNGCLFGRSLNGETFPINVECVVDAFTGKPIRA